MSKPARIDPAEQPSGEQVFPVWQRPQDRSVTICLLLTLAIVFAFWPVFHAGFINYDDNDYVFENPFIENGLTWKSVQWAFTSNHASNWHPLTWISHMLDVQLFGKGATGPHCVNLLLHTINSILLFLLLKRLTASHWKSLVVAALFALHPTHVESVAWVAERKDVLSTLLGMLTLLAYSRYAEPAKTQRANSKLWYGCTLTLFALGLMCKPMLVTLPCVMLLLDYWPLGRIELSQLAQRPRSLARRFVEKIPFLALSAVSCVLTTWAQQKAMQPLELLPLTERTANALVAYASYLGKVFWPVNLALPYLHPGHWPATQIATASVTIASITLLALTTIRNRPHIFVGWFWYVGTLVPVIGLVQVGAQSMADRYTYIPLIGIFIAIVWTVGNWLERRPSFKIVTVTGCTFTLATFGLLTRQQTAHWRNSESLFKHSAAVTKDNFIALGNIGGALFEAKRLDEAMEYYQRSYQANPRYPESINSIGAVLAAKGREAEAIEWFRKTLELQPNHANALFNLGNTLAKTGQLSEAVRYFQSTLVIKPENHEARNNLGNTLVKLDRLDEAIGQYRLALDYKPDATLIRKNLGEALAAKGRFGEAVSQYREALAKTNDAGTHYSLAMTLAVQGKWAEAIEHYSATVRLSPTNADAHYNLGYAFRVQGNSAKAKLHLAEALRLKSDFPLAHFNLACVLADQNQREEAIRHLREAIRLKPDYEEAKAKLAALESAR